MNEPTENQGFSERVERVEFVEAVGRFVDASGLIAPGSHILVGVSGGADSVALLAVLRALAAEPTRRYQLSVAHLNHGLRESAVGDEEFVKSLAEKWSLPCVIEKCDCKARAGELGKGIEETARMLRYEFMRETAERLGAGCVAVGHHADDNVETVLYRIARGTHIRGLAGIPASRKLTGSNVTLVRPLLGVRRNDIEAYCQASGLQWRDDETNTDTNFKRNFVRHELLPMLRDGVNHRTDDAVLRLAEAAGEIDEYMSSVAASVLDRATVKRGDLFIAVVTDAVASEPPAVRKYVMRLALETLGAPMRMVGLERLCELADLFKPGGLNAVSLPGGWVARRDGQEVIVELNTGETFEEVSGSVAVELNCPGRTKLSDGRIIDCQVEAFDREKFDAHCTDRQPGVELLDADEISGSLLCRPRQDGDSFVPLGSPGRQSVSNFLTNIKLPARQRDEVLCICDEVGIVYLAPLRIESRVKLGANTTRVIRLSVAIVQ